MSTKRELDAAARKVKATQKKLDAARARCRKVHRFGMAPATPAIAELNKAHKKHEEAKRELRIALRAAASGRRS